MPGQNRAAEKKFGGPCPTKIERRKIKSPAPAPVRLSAKNRLPSPLTRSAPPPPKLPKMRKMPKTYNKKAKNDVQK